ncbi:hypothetical protein BJX66DRAFT_341606 [Aspergillus keveii]|uniref:Ankyrin repeat protein n=1 Tax=Aspergillus keveii TaxID=714993 RepID=A0ABR4FUU6_9EURO
MANRPLAVVRQLEDDIREGNEDRFQKDFTRLAPLGADRQRELIKEYYLLHQAADQNSLQILTLLLSVNPDTNARNLQGRSALHIAAVSRSENAPKIIAALIRHGSDSNMRDGRQWPPLHQAVESRAAENALRLIGAGAEVNATAPSGGTPIHLALDTFQNTPLTAVVLISALLSAGADPNSRDCDGNTPLHRVRQVESQIVDRLLEAGADPNAQDHEGRTSLHTAVVNNEYPLAERLYSAGGDPTAVDQYGLTPSSLAADHGYAESFEDLFKAPRTIQKTKPRLPYQPARPFEPNARRREVCTKFRGSFWYIETLENGADSHELPEYNWTRKASTVECCVLPVARNENSTPEDVTLHQLTRATPTVYNILYGDALLNGFRDMSIGFRWIHLPFTIKLWVDHLIEAISRFSARPSLTRIDGDTSAPEADSLRDSADIKRFISESFNETGLVIGYRQPGFMTEDSPGKQTPSRVSLVLPLIDVDYSIAERTCLKNRGGSRGGEDERNQAHIQAMRELKGSYNDGCCRLHSPRTLDESSYDFLQNEDLERRDQGQVLTVYLEGQKALAEAESATPGLRSCNTRHGSLLSGCAVPKPRSGAVTHSLRALWKSITGEKPTTPSVRTHQENDDLIRPKMLMVPQLWLWKLDERTIISAYPERWDPHCGQSMFDKVRKKMQFCTTVDEAIVKIADTCVNYIEDPWYVSRGRAYTTFDAFDYAIAEVSNDVTKLYEEFEESMISANKNIHIKVQDTAGLLKDISDVIDEIGIIKRVLEDQALGMKNIIRWRSQKHGSDSDINKAKYIHYPLERFSRLEQNASSVRNSLITLLDIWQRESIIDDAREQSRQSRVLFIFTIVTVCFLPLSFIGQLLALPIHEVHRDVGDHFGAAWVVEVEVIAMIITFIVILPLFWMGFGLPEYVKSIWKSISPSAWHLASDKNKHKGSDDRKHKGDESRQPSVKLCPLVRPRLKKRQPNKTRSDLENGTAGVGGASSPE